MAFELAQVVAQLVEAIGFLGEVEGGEHRKVDLFGGPAADVSAAVQEDFEQTDDAWVVDAVAGIANRANGVGKGDAWEVDMDVEPLRLKAGEAAGDVLEPLARTASR